MRTRYKAVVLIVLGALAMTALAYVNLQHVRVGVVGV